MTLTSHPRISRHTIGRRLAAPGRPARQDYEYRYGTANVFVAVDAHRPWRGATVTARRAAVDFATWIRDLIDGPYAAYDRIQIIVDNLSTHTSGAFYEAFAPAEARRVLRNPAAAPRDG